jgi:hypothetical protein
MRTNKAFQASTLLAAVLLFTSTLLNAQYENGSIVGTIRDKSGAGIPNAAVTITNNATALATKATTNAEGDYEAPSLHVGVYTIAASSAGFTNAVANNIAVAVGGRQRIDLTLNVGATETTVEVSDVALQLETETSERGQTGDHELSERSVSTRYPQLLRPAGPDPRLPSGAYVSDDQLHQLAHPRWLLQRQRPAKHVQ